MRALMVKSWHLGAGCDKTVAGQRPEAALPSASGQQILDHVAVDVGQAIVAALEPEGQALVVET